MPKKVIIAGGGFTGMSLAAYLSRLGFEAEIFEKNDFPGGKTHRLIQQDFSFELGAMFYLFPTVIERFLQNFNYRTDDIFRFKKVRPTCRFFFDNEEYIDLGDDMDENKSVFASLEKGGEAKFAGYMERAVKISHDFFSHLQEVRSLELNEIMYRSRNFLGEDHSRYVRRTFQNNKLRVILEFPLPYLNMGNYHPMLPYLLNHQFFSEGLLHPEGGMSSLTEVLLKILDEQQVQVNLGSPLTSFDVIGDRVSGMLTHQKDFHADIFISTMDYQFTEELLPREFRNYPEKFWKRRHKKSSVLVFYLGFDTKLKNLKHHNLVFEDFFERKGKSVSLKKPAIIHICCTSKTENTAPTGMENVTIRMKVPEGIEDTGKLRELYFSKCIKRLEMISGQSLSEHIVYKKTFAMNDFRTEYNSFRGTFDQSHLLRGWRMQSPLRISNRKLGNLYYGEIAGILGPGIPSSVLVGEALANQVYSDMITASE